MGSRGGSFEFVMQDPNEKFSSEARAVIRRQAIRAVNAARQRLGHSSRSESSYGGLTAREYDVGTPLPQMPYSGLELLVSHHGIDPMDLGSLTSVHIGSIASLLLAADPSKLSGILLCRQRSYFAYIPPRFGHAMVLDDAFRCLLTLAHCILVPDQPSSRKKVLPYYGVALRSLQSAVNDSRARYSVEVLCATALLALFEILNAPHGRLWSQHIAGAARLVQLRTPSRFTSEFDKTLFVSLSYPICAEALFKNEVCFLSEPAWLNFIASCAVPGETFTDRSRLGIDLMLIKPNLAGIAKRTNHAVLKQDTLQLEDFEAIAADIRVLRSSILVWRSNFNTALLHVSESTQNDTTDFGKRYELLGLSIISNIILNRLLLSVSPKERAVLEEEVQILASELKTVQGSVKHHRRAEFFLGQKAKIADAAIATHVYFRDVLYSGVMVESWRLEKFFEAIGRKYCDGETCCNPMRG